MSDNYKENKKRRDARKLRTRFKVRRVKSRNRLSVFKTNKHIYAQIIDDFGGKTLASSSTLIKDFKAIDPKLKGVDAAKWVGKNLAEQALKDGIKQVVFDRGRFLYHGRVKALAEAAREQGLEF